MVDLFNNRMEAQRDVLNVVNGRRQWREELCGLSLNAIERWVRANQVDRDGSLTTLLMQISTKLSFLATKSQEQVSEDYRKLSSEVSELTDDLNAALG